MKFLSMLAAAVIGISGTTTTPGVVAPEHCVNITHTLSLNSTGSEVVQLQKFLNVRTSGYFGPLTQSALIKWQQGAHVITSAKSPGAGTAGPKTRLALKCQQITDVASVTKIPISINPPTASPSTTTIPTTTPPLPQQASAPIGVGRGAGSSGGSSATPQCPAFTPPQPPASQCQWQWQLIQDEAGCPAWDCSDPNATQ